MLKPLFEHKEIAVVSAPNHETQLAVSWSSDAELKRIRLWRVCLPDRHTVYVMAETAKDAIEQTSPTHCYGEDRKNHIAACSAMVVPFLMRGWGSTEF